MGGVAITGTAHIPTAHPYTHFQSYHPHPFAAVTSDTVKNPFLVVKKHTDGKAAADRKEASVPASFAAASVATMPLLDKPATASSSTQ